MSFQPLFETSWDQLSPNNESLRRDIRQVNGVPGFLLHDFLSPAECQEILQCVLILQSHWRRGTCVNEFTLGRSWYTAIDNREVADYFDEAPQLNKLLLDTFPFLYERINAFCKTLVNDDNVVQRPGWAGPGIVVFSPDSGTAIEGGSQHIDYEGVPTRLLDATTDGVEVFSCMIPLSLPMEAGNLRVWPEVYQRYHHDRYQDEIEDPQGEFTVLPYKVGTLCGIHSLRVHQIEPFVGNIPRVIVTFHLANLDGQWTIWF